MSSEKTEAPTPRKMADARAEGQVARSSELSAAAALLAGALLLRTAGGQLVDELRVLLSLSLTSLPQFAGFPSAEINTAWLSQVFLADLLRLAPGLGFLLLGLLLTGVAVNIAQTGFIWANKRLGFKFDRLNPLDGLKRLCSLNGFVELVKSMLKLLVVGWLAYSFLRSNLETVLSLGLAGFDQALSTWANLAISLALRVGAAYLVLALVDYAYQRWKFTKSLRMSKEEVKEDLRRSEGDPFVRGRIRAQQRRMARMRMMANVHKADVVITNPTHLALAIQYVPSEMNAPRLLAKGADHVAEKIVMIARQHQVPVVQNIPVARALYGLVEIDQEIPPELYAALAEVLAYVYRLRKRLPAAQASPSTPMEKA